MKTIRCTNLPAIRPFLAVCLTALWVTGCEDHKAELDKLRQENQELAQAQAQSQEIVRNKETQIEQLRKSVEELPRLRNEYVQFQRFKKEAQQASNVISQLQGEVTQLRGAQVLLTQTVAQQQQQQQANVLAQACVANLKQINGAVATWALENKRPGNAVPTDVELFGADRYIRVKPVCPAGGQYSIGGANTKPACSIPGHAF